MAAVTKPKSTLDQVEDLFRPASREVESCYSVWWRNRQPAPVVASEPAAVETLLRSLLSGHLAPVPQPRQDPSDVIGMPSCVSLVGRRVIV